MTHDDYSIQFDDWLVYERENQKRHVTSKPFIGDRSYRHLDGRISLKDLESNNSQIIPNLKDPARLETYSFFPFIRRDKKVRRFTRDLNPNTNQKEVKIKQKLRPIMYASHRDACIYGFYAYMLKLEHDKLVKQLDLHNSVIAYRRIARDDNKDRNKSNIDFAHDVYTALGKERETALMTLDVSDFFGTMQHERINQKWCALLGVSELPVGHAAVFRSITGYRYFFLYEAMVALGIGKLQKGGRFVYSPKAERVGPIAKIGFYNKTLNNKQFIHKNRSPKGIPQGSPISDIIANNYLLEFDKSITQHLSQFPGTLYKRYSDDILIVCPQHEVKNIYKFAENYLNGEGLVLNANKTELFFINRDKHTLKDETARLVSNYTKNKTVMQYLGFEFDLVDIHIRSGTIANHYRKIVRKLKDDDKNTKKKSKPSSSRTKRDRYAYIKSASSRMGSKRLGAQQLNIRKRVAKLRREAQPKKVSKG